MHLKHQTEQHILAEHHEALHKGKGGGKGRPAPAGMHPQQQAGNFLAQSGEDGIEQQRGAPVASQDTDEQVG